MEADQADRLAASFADLASSRRSILERFGGGLAALLATWRVVGFAQGDVEAKKRKRKRKKRKRKGRRKGNAGGGGDGGAGGSNQAAGFPITGSDPPSTTCQTGEDCQSGFCSNVVNGVGVCAQCEAIQLCSGGTQCCAVSAFCNPTLDVCLFA
jgi:hypothetical protein